MEQRLSNATEFLRDAPFTWAVCGGYALDLFHGHAHRSHGDVDICTFERDRNAILQFMLQRGWVVYEFRGQGKVRPLDAASISEAGRNLMCLKPGCELVRFYPCEDEGLLYHEFLHEETSQFDYIEFLFNQSDETHFVFDSARAVVRDISRTILQRDSIPYLAPEIVLLYKASQPDMSKNIFDFEKTFPRLTAEQQCWFAHSLGKLYPDGHPWLGKLSSQA